ncbi:MAG: SAM-dependent methyltransferase, partial [Proteobacteria bacterium]|nr:SAM-dependent methyltransferase [Pseudomonadota bacterium]
MKCRHCSAELELTLIDLGNAPPSNAYLTESTPRVPEKWFPLRVLVCTECWLVQTEDYAGIKELFDAEYAYFSSFSITWLRHAEAYVAEMIERFELNASSNVIEVA